MLDIEVNLAVPTDKEWVGEGPIAVTYKPIREDEGYVSGVGNDLQPIRLKTGADELPFPLLYVNDRCNAANT